jgi:8-amino-7-oxononanoate synthase
MTTWADLVAERLAAVTRADRWRAPRPFAAAGPRGQLEGRPVVAFASNDYLGLSVHPAVVAAAGEALARDGAGAGASRLVTGSRPVHHDLEAALAERAGTEAAAVFPTGYATNLGVLSTLGTTGTRIFSDELNHASIIDGCRLARAEVAVYRHADPDHLGALLARGDGPALVVTDTVFSMDGDVAPLAALAGHCRRHRALLVVDEAHAVLGPTLGPEVTEGVQVVRVGTLSKTLGAQGGYVAASSDVVALVVNLARSYIFTTALTPADAAAARAALEVLGSAEGAALVARLRTLVEAVAPGHSSPIVPVVLGSEERALAASAALLAEGLFVPAIRPPTVAEGTSRLRVTLSAAHRDEEVDRLVAALARLDPARAGASAAAGVP